MSERVFSRGDVVDLPEGLGPGLLVADAVGSTYEQAVGHLSDGTTVRHIAYEQDGVIEAGMAMRTSEGIQILGLLQSEVEPPVDGLGLAFAEHLARTRRENGKRIGVPVVSSGRPDIPEGWIRLPHMLTLRSSSSYTDTVLWELMTEHEGVAWLGDALPDQSELESYLPWLLELRQTIRTSRPAPTDTWHELYGLLDKGRYMSTLFVYQHLDLFRRMYEEFDD